MTDHQKAFREATTAGVEDAEEMADVEVQAQVQLNKCFWEAGKISPLDGPKLVNEAFRISNEEQVAYEKEHGKPMPLPKVS